MNDPRVPYLPDSYHPIPGASIPFTDRVPRITIKKPEPKPKEQDKEPPAKEDKK